MLMSINGKVKRSLGQILITPKARKQLHGEEVTTALIRHIRGDDGELDEYAGLQPEQSALTNARCLSVYRSKDGGRFWVITESDRSFTTVLMPEEF